MGGNKEKEKQETRTAEEELFFMALSESYYADGGIPEEFNRMIRQNPNLAKIYDKQPFSFNKRRSIKENDEKFCENITSYLRN